MPDISIKFWKHSRKDSAIEIKISPINTTTSNDGLVALPTPEHPRRISPRHKLLKKSFIKQHPKTLHELISSACQATCTLILRRSTLSSGMNLIVTDPAVVDLLLTCLSAVNYTYNRKMKGLDLLPGCPIADSKLKDTINDLPGFIHLSIHTPKSDTYSSTSTLGPTSTSSSSTHRSAKSILATLPSKHRSLLTWVLTSPFAHLSSLAPSANPALRIPSLETLGYKVFVVTQQPPNKEALFRYHSQKSAPFPVFHGTHPSRLPPILAQGLRNMSGTRYQMHGKVMGPGIYLASDPGTSFAYSQVVLAWKGSQWYDGTSARREANVRVLLGCEVAGIQRGNHKYVVPDEGKVVVRFVFLATSKAAKEPGPEVLPQLERAMEVLREMRGG